MIDEIQARFRRKQYEYSLHAADQSIVRGISVEEIEGAVASGEVIEEYATDKYGPSCLILGKTESGRVIHVQVTSPIRPTVKIITVYEPNPELWIDFRERR